MELRQLRYFVTVAEELHFGRAAERLHIVQAAVSQQIRKLERELGAELFDRSPRTVRLTAAGKVFLPEARTVLAAASRAKAKVAALAGPRPAVLRLGTSNGLGERLDLVLDALARTLPEVSVELVASPTRERLDQVRAQRLDATFVRGITESPELRLIPLWRDAVTVALPADHPLAGAPSVELAELAELPLRLVERSRNPPLHDLMLASCRAAGFEPVLGPPFTTVQDTLATVGAGGGWTVVYEAHARRLPTPRVAFLRPGTPIAMTTLLAVSETAPPWCLDALLRACDHDW
ncbi:LysR family transcriptional regulator [Amycolatopsis rhizosphaerae]|uniref:LysR family transcriptional regulator n=1 Tax=Amycolatopsis rhizosphaerae TaxID=2053003 RepID=A0A558DD34_9PSEU|nr:LysR substrate-binding domain-containing protein [Amycolatopsis rhizosphaerae]TVT58898.1 LysR family transcriptional regulator [Amycolatopsis rhizosphaerae]